MSTFGNFSFGNTQQPATTAGTSTTFGSAPAFGMATSQPQQTTMPSFSSTPSQTAQPTGFGTQPAQTPSTGLFNLSATPSQAQQQTNTTGFAFNFASNQAAKPATTQQPTSTFGSGLFASSSVPTSTTTNQLTTTGASSFNFNLGGATTSSAQPSTAPTFSLTSTAPTTQQANQSLLGNTTLTTNQSQQSISLAPGPQTTQTTTASKPSGFALNFASGQPSQPSALTNATTTTSQVTTTISAPATTIAQSQQPVPSQQPTQMTFKQLEGYINVWLNELNQMESDFQKQSQTINSWDSLLVNNALKITNLNENLDLLKEEHKRIDQQLDFVISQQNELEQLLEPLEKIQIDFNVNDTASTEREFTYSLVDTVSNDLQGIGSELQNFIKKLNETKANQDLNDPLSSIGKILNSHMDALQYIEHQISVMKRNVEA